MDMLGGNWKSTIICFITPNFQDPRLIIGQMCQRRASLSQGQHCRILHVFAQQSHLLTLDPKFLKAKNDRWHKMPEIIRHLQAEVWKNKQPRDKACKNSKIQCLVCNYTFYMLLFQKPPGLHGEPIQGACSQGLVCVMSQEARTHQGVKQWNLSGLQPWCENAMQHQQYIRQIHLDMAKLYRWMLHDLSFSSMSLLNPQSLLVLVSKNLLF